MSFKNDKWGLMALIIKILGFVFFFIITGGCSGDQTTESRDAERVSQQASQYEKAQPIPTFDWSLERDLLRKLYVLRNQKVITHSVWRSDHGMIEGDCASYGYGMPYDSSLTNPLVATDIDNEGEEHSVQGGALTTIEQQEPNGIFPSKNTSATWVMCLGPAGTAEPIYVETKVTAYPYPVKVDYATNRVTKAGKATVTIDIEN